MTQPDITCVTCLMDGRSTATTSASTTRTVPRGRGQRRKPSRPRRDGLKALAHNHLGVYYQNSPGEKVENASPQPLPRLLPVQARERGRKSASPQSPPHLLPEHFLGEEVQNTSASATRTVPEGRGQRRKPSSPRRDGLKARARNHFGVYQNSPGPGRKVENASRRLLHGGRGGEMRRHLH